MKILITLLATIASSMAFSQIVINGTVLDTSAVVNSGEVILYEATGIAGTLTAVDSQVLTTGGSFQLEASTAGYYIVLAKPDGVMYPGFINTYNGDVPLWEQAPQLYGQGDTLQENITLILPPDWSGSSNQGACGGFVKYGTSGKRILAGDPIPGIDISLEQIPGGIIKAGTETDIDGYYEVDKIPDGSNYVVLVDMVGYPMDSTHTVAITNGNMVPNQNFIVDTTEGAKAIYVTDWTITEVHQVNQETFEKITTYPNPSNGLIHVDLPYSQGHIKIVDVQGRILSNRPFNSNKLQIDLSAEPKGLYFAHIMMNGNTSVQKLIVE